jgi:hypothetical protein
VHHVVTEYNVVEKFHVLSENFDKELLVELRYRLEEYAEGHSPASPSRE